MLPGMIICWKDLQLDKWLQKGYNQRVFTRQIQCEVIAIRKLYLILLVFSLSVGMLLLTEHAEAATAESKAGAVTTSGSRLNVRSAPSTGAATVATLRKGSYITLISKSGDWWYVEYGRGAYGYCHEDYITVVEGSPASVNTQSGSLNVRSGPGTSYSRTGTLGKGEWVILLSSSGGWSRVLYQGTQTGYVSASYLSSSYSRVSLSVPDFKQNDSRWAGTLIGQSGKTMAQIGCATTAIAMMESARTGETVFPDEMAGRLRYTPSGSVYWPEHYKVVTNPGDYLSGIYTLLKQGKPVLLGARNAAGKQHWVVVTGFTGGSRLSADSFTIRDPGSVSRTTLGQFMDLYPHFYKYFSW